MGDIVAVLTGDLIQSNRLSRGQLEEARAHLYTAADEVRKWGPRLVVGTPEFFRGDAWQMLLSEPKWALRVAVLLRASILGGGLTDTRVAIGLGAVDQVDTKRISLSTGEAFRLSGQALDELADDFRISIAVPRHVDALSGWLRVVVQLCDTVISQWTTRQAELVRMMVDPDGPTQKAVAGRLVPPVTPQTVSKGLAGAGWRGLRSALAEFEMTDWEQACRKSLTRQP